MSRSRQQEAPLSSPVLAGAPLHRWTGSKRQLLTRLMQAHPGEPSGYFEPMWGSGVFGLQLLANGLAIPERTVLSDANADLLALWRAVQTDVKGLIPAFFDGHVAKHSPDHYRDQVFARPTELVERGARFLYLLSAGFNGLYRVNKRAGRYNVPQGDRFTPPSAELLIETAVLLEGVQIVDGPYQVALLGVAPGDVVYFDPPYLGDWCGYQAEGWTEQDTRSLAVTAQLLKNMGAVVIISCPDHPVVRALFDDWNIQVVNVHRSGGGKGAFRGQVSELLITGGVHA